MQARFVNGTSMQAIEKAGTQISYGQLLHEMHTSLKSLGGGSSGASGGSGLGGLLGGNNSKLVGTLLNVGQSFLPKQWHCHMHVVTVGVRMHTFCVQKTVGVVC